MSKTTDQNRQQRIIYVLDFNGEPLMPTQRFGKVRRWLKTGEVIWYGNSRNVIQFTRPVKHNTQKIVLGNDVGQHLGLSAVDVENNREYISLECYRDWKGEVERNKDCSMYR